MPGRENFTYAYRLAEGTYHALPPAPVRLSYIQGVCDGRKLYVVGRRDAGRSVLELSKASERNWQWRSLRSLPESEGRGRWLAAVGLLPQRRLFLALLSLKQAALASTITGNWSRVLASIMLS